MECKAMMTADEYQTQAGRTLIDSPDNEYTGNEIMLAWCALGLTGEAGEVADAIKKSVFHRHPFDRDELIKELGDVLWYVAALCTKIDVSMSDIMQRNVDKLKKRYPEGYNSTNSMARVDKV
jgi:NTP pyrophosphatase (non-canonical NTP hydrolase)